MAVDCFCLTGIEEDTRRYPIEDALSTTWNLELISLIQGLQIPNKLSPMAPKPTCSGPVLCLKLQEALSAHISACQIHLPPSQIVSRYCFAQYEAQPKLLVPRIHDQGSVIVIL